MVRQCIKIGYSSVQYIKIGYSSVQCFKIGYRSAQCIKIKMPLSSIEDGGVHNSRGGGLLPMWGLQRI